MSPARAQPVVIRLPEARELPARVDESDAGTLTLVLSVAPDERVPPSSAIVEWSTPTGIHRVAGALTPATEDSSVLRLERSGEEHLQRREWARVAAAVPVVVRFEDPDSGLAATMTLDVSGGGALIRDPVGLALGTRVDLELRLDGGPIAATGVVVRAAGADLKGIALTSIAHGDRERLVHFVMARQRAGLRERGRA